MDFFKKLNNEFTNPDSVMRSQLRGATELPAKLNNEIANPDSMVRSKLRGAAAAAAASVADAAETAADSSTVVRRELGDATVAVGSLVARLATSVSGALRDGEFSAESGGLVGSILRSPAGVDAAEAAAASAAAAAEEDGVFEEADEEAAALAEAEGQGGLGMVVRLPRFLRPSHGAVVLFVGGGPVGLWTALQLRLLRPLWRVAVAERHAKYVRSHVLRVSAASFERAVSHPEARAFVARLLGGRAAVSVRTTELERALRTLAQGLGVEVLVGEAVRALPLGTAGGGRWLVPPSQTYTHSEPLQNLLTTASVIVACDGARSPCRRLLFGSGGSGAADGAGASGLREAQSLAYMVHVRYEASGATRRLSALEAAAVFNAMGFVGEEYVGRSRGDPPVAPCTLTLVVSEDSLGSLRGGGGGGGGGGAVALAEALWSPQLRDAVRLWLNAKRDIAGEVRVAGSEMVAVVHLSVYRAEAFVTYASRLAAARPLPSAAGGAFPAETAVAAELPGAAAPQSPAEAVKGAAGASPPAVAEQQLRAAQLQRLVPPPDCAFALVGDAAFGVPYYRSLNNGLVCGSELAAALSEHGSSSGNAWRCGAGSPPLEAYARFSERLASQEMAAARLRAKALAFASSGASVAHSLSSQRLALPAGSLVFDAARIERWRQWP